MKRGGIIAFHDTVYTKGYNEDVPRLMDDLRDGKYTDGELELIDIHESKTQGITFFKKNIIWNNLKIHTNHYQKGLQ